MDSKLLLADLVQILADKGFPRKEAEVFCRCFFQQIEKYAFAGESVKISGLGTFKLQKVEPRKSVNVNSGEEIEIEGHYKFSYVPDADLKEAVNRPYAHFDNIEVDAAPESPLFSVFDSGDEAPKKEKQPKPAIPAPPAPVLQDAQPGPDEGSVVDIPLNKEELAVDEPGLQSGIVGLVLKVLGTCALLAGIIFMFMHSESRKATYTDAPKITIVHDSSSMDAKPVTAPAITAVAEKPAAEKAENPLPQKEVGQEVKPAPAKAATVKTTDDDLILIIGSDPLTWETAKTVMVKRGDRLTIFSLQNYGEKIFWTYLFLANRDVLTNPNSLPEGTVIRIPKVQKSIVNANDPASLTKARAVEERLKERYD